MILLGLCYVYVGNMGKVNLAMEQIVEEQTTGELLKDNELGQTFVSKKSNLSGFSFKIGTYMRSNKSDIVLGIRELGERTDIYNVTLSASSLVDNDYFGINFPPIKFSKNKKFYIYAKSLDAAAGNGITLYSSKEDVYNDGSLYINNSEQPIDAAFKVYYNKTLFSR